MEFTYVKIVTTAPLKDADAVREALGKAGAGVVGGYSFCSFSVVGTGRFTPSKDADPHIGTPGKPQKVQEEQIHVTCRTSEAKRIIAALKAAHPYEEPIIEITPLLDEDSLA